MIYVGIHCSENFNILWKEVKLNKKETYKILCKIKDFSPFFWGAPFYNPQKNMMRIRMKFQQYFLQKYIFNNIERMKTPDYIQNSQLYNLQIKKIQILSQILLSKKTIFKPEVLFDDRLFIQITIKKPNGEFLFEYKEDFQSEILFFLQSILQTFNLQICAQPNQINNYSSLKCFIKPLIKQKKEELFFDILHDFLFAAHNEICGKYDNNNTQYSEVNYPLYNLFHDSCVIQLIKELNKKFTQLVAEFYYNFDLFVSNFNSLQITNLKTQYEKYMQILEKLQEETNPVLNIIGKQQKEPQSLENYIEKKQQNMILNQNNLTLNQNNQENQ